MRKSKPRAKRDGKMCNPSVAQAVPNSTSYTLPARQSCHFTDAGHWVKIRLPGLRTALRKFIIIIVFLVF
jgi:hypothetical protein